MNKLVNNIPNDLDARDQEILAEIFERRAAFTFPCMGDYVVFPGGQLERFSSDYSDRIQTSPSGSFYLTSSGFGSLGSGGLNPSIPRSTITPTDATLPGTFWFFHHGIGGAGRGVYFDIPCRVFKTSAKYEGFLSKDFACPRIAALAEQVRDLVMPA